MNWRKYTPLFLLLINLITLCILFVIGYNLLEIDKRIRAEPFLSIEYRETPGRLEWIDSANGAVRIFSPGNDSYEFPDLTDVVHITNTGTSRSNTTEVTLQVSDPFSIENIAVLSESSQEYLESEKVVLVEDRPNYTKVIITINEPLGVGEKFTVYMGRVYNIIAMKQHVPQCTFKHALTIWAFSGQSITYGATVRHISLSI